MDCLKQGEWESAAKWLRASAEQGNADAQLVLGTELMTRKHFSVNLDEAEGWLKKASVQGSTMATDALACLAKSRKGTRFYDSEEEMLAAAEKGDANAEYGMAQRCLARDDRAAAEKWVRPAAEQAHRDACSLLAHLLLEGKREEGVRWARLAAELGADDALDLLGVAYGTGLGVKEDLVEALAWLDLAAEAGSTEAPIRREQCAERAGAARVALALTRVRELKLELEQAKARLVQSTAPVSK